MRQKHYINQWTVAVPAGETSSAGQIEMPRDGFDVEVRRLSVTAVNAAGAVVDPNVTIQIYERGGQNESMFIESMHARNLVGDGSIPWELDEPWLVSGSVRLALDVTNLDPANAVTVYVGLVGRRVKPGHDEDHEKSCRKCKKTSHAATTD